MLTSCGVFGFVVLDDAVLLPLLNALPIGFKGDVQQSILAKRWLCRRGLCCGVHDTSNGIADSCKDALQSKSCVEIMLAADVSCANHVPDHLVDAFNDAIGLRVSCGNFSFILIHLTMFHQQPLESFLLLLAQCILMSIGILFDGNLPAL